MNLARVKAVPLCAGCRQERKAMLTFQKLDGLVLHDERCACYVIVPERPRYGTGHVHPMEERRPWLTGARGGRYDAVPPARDSEPRVKVVRKKGS